MFFVVPNQHFLWLGGKIYVVYLSKQKYKVMKLIRPGVYENFVLDCIDPMVQLLVIDTLKANGIPVYEHTNEYDPNFPYLKWDGECLCQTTNWKGMEKYSLGQFMNKFMNISHTVRLNSEYLATVTKENVKVGCQTFSHEVIDKLYEASQEVRKK